MKNFRLQSFEKNNYFYGKLLTVRDFQIEQKYNDEKRWMMNRLMFGSGVVTGLKAVMIDEQTISVEPGVALDALGREIVISSPITQKLSLMDGFDNSGYSKNIYLCVDYDEKGKERIQAITNAADENSDDVSSYNRIQENYKMYLKESISDNDLNKSSSFIHSKTCIFENDKIQIFQTTPKFLEPSEEFDIKVEVLKKDISSRVEFNYLIESSCADSASVETGGSVRVDFKEPIDDTKSSYTLKYNMRAKGKPEKNAMLCMNISSIKINDNETSRLNDIFTGFSIIEDKLNAILKEHSEKSADSLSYDDSFETIYIAKIEILKVGAIYLIKSINNVPFNQYIYNNPIISEMVKQGVKCENNRFTLWKNRERGDFSSSVNEQTCIKCVSEEEKPSSSSGEYIFRLDYNMKYPNTIYSEELFHGLGSTEAFINTAIVGDDNFEDVLISGDVDIFEEQSCKIATILNPQKGSFVIAVKVFGGFRNNQIRIKWQAVKSNL